MAINDQFLMGRVPLKPLPYDNKNLAQCCELLIDYTGENKSYHIFLTDPQDRTKFIDLTQKIITEAFPDATVNANNFKVTIEGKLDALTLQEVINYIYKRFITADDPNGFDYESDIDKVYNEITKSVLLKDQDNIYYLPVTLASNVFDSNGQSIQSRLDNMTRVGFSTGYVRATSNNQCSFEFDYPFPDYEDGYNLIEVRIGSTYIDKARYEIIPIINKADNKSYRATLNFIDETVEIGRAVNFLFIFNSAAPSGSKLEYLYGGHITNGSIPTTKLEKISDKYLLNDSTSVASSKAVYNCYKEMTNTINNWSPYCLYTVDTNNTSTAGSMLICTAEDFIVREGCSVNVRLTNDTKVGLKINLNNKVYDIYDGKDIINYTIANGNLIKLIYSSTEDVFYINSLHDYRLTTNRRTHTVYDQETTISFVGLEYGVNDQIFVYRNGVRLFEGIDYSMNRTNETINVYVRTEDGERFIFESYNVERR